MCDTSIATGSAKVFQASRHLCHGTFYPRPIVVNSGTWKPYVRPITRARIVCSASIVSFDLFYSSAMWTSLATFCSKRMDILWSPNGIMSRAISASICWRNWRPCSVQSVWSPCWLMPRMWVIIWYNICREERSMENWTWICSNY